MGKNIKGGSKHKKYARQRENVIDVNIKNLKKDNEQEYAHVLNVLGNCRFDLICSDGKKRLGCLRGSMKKRKWVNRGDCVLVGLRDFQDDKCDIIHVYQSEQVQVLVKKSEFNSSFANDGSLENLNNEYTPENKLEQDEILTEEFDVNNL
jgi:translation initiation factor 1A